MELKMSRLLIIGTSALIQTDPLRE